MENEDKTKAQLIEKIRVLEQELSFLLDRHNSASEMQVSDDAWQNISQRQASENALRLSEEKLRVLFEGSSDIITLTDAQANPLIVNPAWKKIFGESIEAEQNPFERIHPDDIPVVRRDWEGLLVRGEAIRGLEYRYQVDDKYLFFESNAFPVIVGGEKLHYVVARDITDRKKAEEDCRADERLFQSIFEQAAVGIARVGVKGEWLDVNQRLCDIVGYTREELLERTFQDITHI